MRASRLVPRLAIVAVTAAAFLMGPFAATAHATHADDCSFLQPSLSPMSQDAKIGGTATVTAGLADSAGAPCAGYRIDFLVSDGAAITRVTTDTNGKATFQFSRSAPAVVQVIALNDAFTPNYGGPVTVTWKYPSTLVANPSVLRLSGLKLYLTLSAHLASPFGPLGGLPVTFAAAGKTVCVAPTNVNGDASCGGLIPGTLSSILGLGYTASYAGNTKFLPSSAAGALIA